MLKEATKAATFHEAIRRSLASEGFPDRRVLKTFAPLEATEATEALVVHAGKYAETVYVTVEGCLIHGPCPGFGPPKGN